MFKRHYRERRHSNPLFVIFRLILSVFMFGVLLVGVYSSYKHFSGLDPLKLDPQSVLKNVLLAKKPQELLGVLSSFKITQGISSKISKTVLVSSQSGLENLTKQNVVFRFLLIADSHNDSTNLKVAISQARQTYPDLKFIIGLGDYTDVGTIEELKNTKIELDNANLRYFLIPGDHDLWDSRNRNLPATSDFTKVFGPNYQSFTYENYRFLLIDNSDDYLGLGEAQLKWINNELEKAKSDSVKGIFIFVHEPLFHPSSDHVMGKLEKDLRLQAKTLIFQFKGAGVKKIFAGDIHYFSEYSEPETNLSMVTVGAVVTDRNPQSPRYAVVSVLDDSNTKVEDIEIK